MYTEKENCARYIVMCINEFAQIKNIDSRSSFRYLYNNNGIKFLKENYDIEHTLPINDTMEALTIICQKHGGMIE